jgi:membrane protease YdiL (CAAX protease family)
MGYVAFEESHQPTGLMFLGGILIVLVGWTVQGAAEEVLTRGFLLPVISVRYGVVAGIALSSLLFTALHLLNANLSWLALLNLFLFGVFASLYALQEGGLWGVCALHGVWNWAQGNLYGLAVSGGDAHTATLINLKEVGPDWLTGGAFGPEGGLAVTLVLVVGCAVIGWMNRRGAQP